MLQLVKLLESGKVQAGDTITRRGITVEIVSTEPYHIRVIANGNISEYIKPVLELPLAEIKGDYYLT